MINTGGSLRIAMQVLMLLQSRAPALEDAWWVEAFSSGREQGYFLTGLAGGIAFARDQDEDGVVVYTGLGRGMFDRIAGNAPGRLCARRLFPSPEAAAEFILGELKRLGRVSRHDGRFGEAV